MSLYGLILALSFFLAFNFFQKTNKLKPFPQDKFFYGLLVFGIIGARVYHVLDNFTYYSQNPSQIIKTWHGGLGIYGGLLGAFIYIIYFCHKNHLKTLNMLNSLAAPTALAQAIGRWGNYTNLEIFGTPTLVSFGQRIPFHLRPIQFETFSYFHPVWLYESLGCLLLFYYLNRQNKNQAAVYLIGYGLLRFGLEFLRFDSWQLSGIKVASIFSLVFILFGLKLYHPPK